MKKVMYRRCAPLAELTDVRNTDTKFLVESALHLALQRGGQEVKVKRQSHLARRREENRERLGVPPLQAEARRDPARGRLRWPAVDVDAKDMGSASVANEHARQLQLARASAVAGVEGRLSHRHPPAGRAELRRYGRSQGTFSFPFSC